MNKSEQFFRCGNCGQPTDKDGRPLDIEVCKLLLTLRHHLANINKEQFQAEWLEIEELGFEGMPIEEFLSTLFILSTINSNLQDDNLNNAELVHGYCCPPQDNYIVVTRDMAIDAGDLSLEGELWKW